jgi:porin
MPSFVGGGVSYQGLVPGRGSDIASAGVIAGMFSHFIPPTTAETVLEANDQITVTRWLSVTPDLQYIIRPSGSSASSNAVVMGVQLALTL